MKDKKELRIDYIKHLNTLSTGSIVVFATFLKDIFKEPEFEYLGMLSLAGFIVSVITAVISYTFEVLQPKGMTLTTFFKFIDNLATYLMWIGFLVGILSLAIFGILNIKSL